MWPAVIIVAGLLGWAGYWWLDRPPGDFKTLIKIHNGACFYLGDPLPRHAQLSVLELLREAGVKSGFIAITVAARVKFSRQIPPALHQRLRNVVLNP